VSDAANAVDDRVDAIMLAGETAIGKYPVRAVQTLDRIIRNAESMPDAAPVALEETHMAARHGGALCEAAITLAERGAADAIVAVTRAGHTAQMLASLRPRAPIYAVTDNADVARRLALWFGVTPLIGDLGGDVSETTRRISNALVSRGVMPSGSVIVVVSVSQNLADLPANFLDLQQI
jgi:pyruvate kinase